MAQLHAGFGTGERGVAEAGASASGETEYERCSSAGERWECGAFDEACLPEPHEPELRGCLRW